MNKISSDPGTTNHMRRVDAIDDFVKGYTYDFLPKITKKNHEKKLQIVDYVKGTLFPVK